MKEFLNIYYDHAVSVPGGFVFDLQLFAAEDEGRTEEPTEKKIREAREKGQVAKTQELGTTLVVLFGMLVVFVFSSWIYGSLEEIMKYYLSSFSSLSVTSKNIQLELMNIIFESAKLLFPIFLAVMIAGVVGNVVQVGFQVTTHPLKWDWTKIKFDPATIMKKVLFSKQVGMNLFKSIFKVLTIGLVAYLIIANDFDSILGTPDLSIALALKMILLSGLKIIIWTSIILLALSVPDYYFQKREFLDSLKMTKQELKEEYKETQGDPHMRARMREMQRDIVMKNMVHEVPKADVVVTNPTHFAVALQYDDSLMEAPTVIAKGVDSIALRIRQIARDNDVAMIENRPLAQQLYRDVEIGDILPEDLFYAVSLVNGELYKKKNFRKAI